MELEIFYINLWIDKPSLLQNETDHWQISKSFLKNGTAQERTRWTIRMESLRAVGELAFIQCYLFSDFLFPLSTPLNDSVSN